MKRRGRIRVRRFQPDGYDHYRIRLSIDGPLDEITSVQYELHPTFRSPVRNSRDRSDRFAIEFWTWGEFEVLVTAYYSDGSEQAITYQLEYSSELPAEDSAYFREDSSSATGS